MSTAIHLDGDTALLELALDVAGYFGLDKKEARRIAGRGIKRAEIERMPSAFENRDLAAARGR